jgi:hypothetical protein
MTGMACSAALRRRVASREADSGRFLSGTFLICHLAEERPILKLVHFSVNGALREPARPFCVLHRQAQTGGLRWLRKSPTTRTLRVGQFLGFINAF